MTRLYLPPKTEEMIDEDKFPTLNWLSFFDSLASGDTGASWTPTFVGLTEVGGAAAKTGKYYRLSNSLAVYIITITPVTNTTAVAGTTYCDNFPLTIRSASASFSCSGYTAAAAGVTASDKRIYTAAWAAITTPVTIVGLLEVQ